MSQSRSMSLVEVSTSVTIGFMLSLAMQALLFPAVGLQATISQNLSLAIGFTALSVLRGYMVRRVFARLGGGRGSLAGLIGRGSPCGPEDG
ncbi:DUF7220 family protein [Sulfitobacter delicatus]|uniref:Uncharacterized protein n=1 Tax=Sulfitobacter delicatus TaxID=218672 RepID=A0A1G7RC09_9RHOB|nr:hypothetical protein [Sulfitobacter delicatus]SDG08297.1 hypothetical protein SAMN04489759_104339 [Sulfitobacter delicatus]